MLTLIAYYSRKSIIMGADMEYIHYLGELSFNPFLIIAMIILALVVISIVFTLIRLALLKPFGGEIREISYFGFKYSKTVDGELKYVGHKPSILFSAEFGMDMKKLEGVDNKKVISRERAFMLTTAFLNLLIGAGVLALCLWGTFSSSFYTLASMSFLFGLCYFVIAIIRTIMVIRVVIRTGAKTLARYTQTQIALLRDGVTFDKMDLKPVNELGFKKVWESERRLYFILYFEYLDYNEMFDRLPEAVADVERALLPGKSAGSKIDQSVFEVLVYYYSYHNIVPSKAKEYYHRVLDEITKDTDSYASCIKGFYELYCFGNADKAGEYVSKALENFDKVQSTAEKEYVRKCIARLNQAIGNFPGRN